MPTSYAFKDSKASDNVAKALLLVAKLSKKQAIVRFGDSSVSVAWGSSAKTFFINATATALDMFRSKQTRPYGLEYCTVVQVNPSNLGKTLKGCSHDRRVSIVLVRPNRLKVVVEHAETSSRTIIHSLPCEFKTLDDFKSMLIEEVEQTVCRFDTISYLDNIHRFKHIIDSFVKLNTPKLYIWSEQTDQGNDLMIQSRTSNSVINVSITDLESGANSQQDPYQSNRTEAGVNIDTKKLAAFMSSLITQKKSKVSFHVEHNKCLKITLDNEIQAGEKFSQSLLLLHSLNN